MDIFIDNMHLTPASKIQQNRHQHLMNLMKETMQVQQTQCLKMLHVTRS